MQIALTVLLFACCAHAQEQLPDSPQPTAVPATPAPATQPNLKPPTTDGIDPIPPGQPVGVAKPKPDQDFPFPEDSNAPTTLPSEAPKPDASAPPPAASGFSSSETLHDEGSSGESPAPNPTRVKQDVKVAQFYWGLGNYEGSYLRYKDAVVYAPQDPETWFGLAESERMLGKYVKAKQDYQHYLALAPQGSKARQVEKEIAKLPAADKVQPERPGPKVP
jgi:hypothetical protein